jgi:hypothetical protein
VMDEPLASQYRDLLECAGLLEDMGGTGDHYELALAGDGGLCLSIELQHNLIATADEQ